MWSSSSLHAWEVRGSNPGCIIYFSINFSYKEDFAKSLLSHAEKSTKISQHAQNKEYVWCPVLSILYLWKNGSISIELYKRPVRTKMLAYLHQIWDEEWQAVQSDKPCRVNDAGPLPWLVHALSKGVGDKFVRVDLKWNGELIQLIKIL